MSVEIRPSEKLPLELLLVDGDDGKFPVAYVVDQDHLPIAGSPFVLTNIGLGRYVNDSYTLPNNYTTRRLTATYITYLDVGHTEEDYFYERAEDVFDMIISPSANIGTDPRVPFTNLMNTVLNNLTGVQEIVVWPERAGQTAPGTDCSIAVIDSSQAIVWAAAAAAPRADGTFRFTNVFSPTLDGGYYVEITITVDGQPRTNKQPFVAVG